MLKVGKFFTGQKGIVEKSGSQTDCLSAYVSSMIKNLVLAPHADDAELAAYGLYEKYAANAMVVTVTASEAGAFPL